MGFERKFETDEAFIMFRFDDDGFFQGLDVTMRSRKTFKVFPRQMDPATTDLTESIYTVLMRKIKMPQNVVTQMVAQMKCPLCHSDAILVPNAESESKLAKLCVVCGWNTPEPKLHREKVHGVTEELTMCDCGSELISTSSVSLTQMGVEQMYECKKCRAVYILAIEKQEG